MYILHFILIILFYINNNYDKIEIHIIYKELYTKDVINDPPRYETRSIQYVVDIIYKLDIISSVDYSDQTLRWSAKENSSRDRPVTRRYLRAEWLRSIFPLPFFFNETHVSALFSRDKSEFKAERTYHVRTMILLDKA